MFGLATSLLRAYSKKEEERLKRLNYENDRKHNNLQRRLARQKAKGILPIETQKALSELTTIKGRSKSVTIAIAREKEKRLAALEKSYDKSYKKAQETKKKELAHMKRDLQDKSLSLRETLRQRIREGVLTSEAKRGLEEIHRISDLQVKDEEDYKKKLDALEALTEKTPIEKKEVLDILHDRNKKLYEVLNSEVVVTDKQVSMFWKEYNKLKQIIGSDPDFYRYKELSEAIIKVVGETEISEETFANFEDLIEAIKAEYNKQVDMLTKSPSEGDDWQYDNPLKW